MGNRIRTWLGFGVLSFVFFICMNSTVYAQQAEEGICVVPTDSGEEHPVPPDWNSKPGIIKIVASSDTISSTAPVNLWIQSNGWGKPPYQWQVSGTGYSLDKNATQSDPDKVTLTSAGGT
jgi:hypothetical protein